MNHFTISDIENLSGIKAHTLRIWEQRYGIVKPKRRKSMHRYYDNEDLKKILRIAELNRNGLKISSIAKLSDEQLRTLSLEQTNTASAYETYMKQFADACLEFNEQQFNQLFNTLLTHIGIEKMVLNILFPLLERIGNYWMNDEAKPVQEHFLSNLVSAKIQMAIATLDVPNSGPVTVLFTPEGEHHEIPLLLTWYLLRLKGKRVVYFGTGVQLTTLKEYVQVKDVNRLHFHLITNFTNHDPSELINKVLNDFPAREIIVSGPVTAAINISNKRLKLLRSLKELVAYCEEDFLPGIMN